MESREALPQKSGAPFPIRGTARFPPIVGKRNYRGPCHIDRHQALPNLHTLQQGSVGGRLAVHSICVRSCALATLLTKGGDQEVRITRSFTKAMLAQAHSER